MIDLIKKLCAFVLVYIIIGLLWGGLEYVFDGEVIPRVSDTIICIIISINLTEWIYKDGENNE